MKKRFSFACEFMAVFISLFSFSSLSQARVYTDQSSDLFDNGLANLDIISVEVTNDSSNVTFTVTTRGFSDWTKYLIGIRTAAASGGSTTGNLWGRNNTYAEGIDYQIASWVDGGGGLGFSRYVSGSWSSVSGASLDLTQIGSNKVSWTVSVASLGLTLGDTFKFDVGTTGGGGGDPFVDLASRTDAATSGWSVASTSGHLLSYTTIDPNADGDLDNDNLQDNWEVTYFGNVTAQDGTGDPDNDGLNNEQEETVGTDPTKADTDGDGWADGSDTNPLVADDVAQNVTFKVDMGAQIFKGAFVVGTDKVYVAGSFGAGNNWNTSANELTDANGDGVYEKTVAVTAKGLSGVGYKFLIGGKTPVESGYENGSDRTFTAAAAGTTPADRTLASVAFANATATREVKFQVDVSVAQASGVFDPATDTVEVIGSFSGWTTGYALSVPNANGVCSLTTFLDGADNTAVNYKFRIKRGTSYNWESDPNRTFNLGPAYVVGGANSPQVLTVDYFNRTGQSRSLTFKVDMGVQISKGLFADGDTLEVRFGDFNAAGKTLTKEGTSSIYAGTFVVPGDAGTVLEYKFRKTNASDPTTFERVDIPRSNSLLNRTYTLGSTGVAVTISPTPYFSNDEGVGPVISLVGASTLNLNVGDAYVELGATANDAVEGTVTVAPSGSVDTATAGTYTVTYSASDANSNAATPVTRTVVVSAVGTTFAGWSGGATLNAANLAKYAIGGASGLTAQGEAPKVGTGFIVPNHYSYIEAIVRTDDSNLSVVGEASTDLDAGFASTGTWTTRGQADGVSQLDVPNGCERKRFIYWHGMVQERMFLRLSATLNP